MEFDKTRIYTAVNADELPIGSRCVFADTVEELKRKVLNVEAFINTLERVYNENEDARFVCNGGKYLLAYLIALPKEEQKEKKYKPFSSVEKAAEAIRKHKGWIKRKDDDWRFFVVKHSMEEILKKYIFPDDGSPCGELVEE